MAPRDVKRRDSSGAERLSLWARVQCRRAGVAGTLIAPDIELRRGPRRSMPAARDDATDSIVRFPGIGLQSGGFSGMLVQGRTRSESDDRREETGQGSRGCGPSARRRRTEGKRSRRSARSDVQAGAFRRASTAPYVGTHATCWHGTSTPTPDAFDLTVVRANKVYGNVAWISDYTNLWTKIREDLQDAAYGVLIDDFDPHATTPSINCSVIVPRP